MPHVDVLLGVMAEGEVEERAPVGRSSIDVVSPPWTTARSHAAKWRGQTWRSTRSPFQAVNRPSHRTAQPCSSTAHYRSPPSTDRRRDGRAELSLGERAASSAATPRYLAPSA